MKLLTTNFLTCAVKACKSSPASFPLHFRDATLERVEMDYNPVFIQNILPRVNWAALTTTAAELGLEKWLPEQEEVERLFLAQEQRGDAGGKTDTKLAQERGGETTQSGDNETAEGQKEEDEEIMQDVEGDGEGSPQQARRDELLRSLHRLLLETSVMEGKLVCGNCSFEYPIKDGVGNFLLPAHLV